MEKVLGLGGEGELNWTVTHDTSNETLQSLWDFSSDEGRNYLYAFSPRSSSSGCCCVCVCADRYAVAETRDLLVETP